MRSMTGYGRGVVARGEVRATVDVRAVNHRYLDLKQRGAGVPAAVEEAIGARIRAAIERGAVVVSVNLAHDGAAGGGRIDVAAATAAHRQLADLASRLGLAGPDLALVLAQPGVVVGDAVAADDASAGEAVLAALDQALAQLAAMRLTEGAALAAELHGRIDELIAARLQLAVMAAELPSHVARKLTERVQRLAADVAIEPGRLAQEIALLADRADITEELVRLASHLDQARVLIETTGAVGRRLDFLVQEIGRELNTIGSKSAAAEITTAIVAAKATLEKVREQVQNVE
jgi:uncharacterized protein (TIGR00255 family)